MALNWRVAYICFVLTVSIASINIWHGRELKKEYGYPNSLMGKEVSQISYSVNIISIVVAIFGFLVLLYELGNKLIAMGYTFALFTCVCLAAIVVIRSSIWIGYSKIEKVNDMKNASTEHVARFGLLSTHLLKIQSKYNCCGVENILEWPSPDMLNMKRRVPDACCIKKQRRCGEKALPYDLIGEPCPDSDCKGDFLDKPSFLKVQIQKEIKSLHNALVAERQDVIDSLKKISLDPCDLKWNNKILYMYVKSSMTGGGEVNVSRWSMDIICFELYYIGRTENTNDNYTYNGDENYIKFLLNRTKQIGKFYVDGCYEHLHIYIADVIDKSLYYAIALAISAIIDMGIFYHYYWKFRIIQLAALPTPVWFEKMGKGDIAPIGIGRKSIHMSEDPEVIAKDLRRRGLLPLQDEYQAKLQRLSTTQNTPRRGRHASVRIFPTQNHDYPTLHNINTTEPQQQPSQPNEQGKEVAAPPAAVDPLITIGETPKQL